MTKTRPDGNAPQRTGIRLEKLGPGQCRFIVDEHSSPVRFCGEPTVPSGSSWCAEHRRLVYLPRSQAPEKQPQDSDREPRSSSEGSVQPRSKLSQQYSPWGRDRSD